MENRKSFELKENIDEKLKKKTITTIFVFFLILLILFFVFIWLKYEVEGVKGISFEIEEILTISTADGKRIENKNKKSKTDKFEVSQVNDVYIAIKEKNINKKDLSLNKISITNFNVQKPETGNIVILEPTGNMPDLFSNSKKNYIDSTIEYKGSKVDNLEKLETSEKGGTIAFRIENNLGSYNVKKDEVLKYDSSLLNKFTKNIEDIKFKINFDLIIELENGVKFSTNIELEKPSEEIFEENKTIVIEDIDEIRFKKI